MADAKTGKYGEPIRPYTDGTCIGIRNDKDIIIGYGIDYDREVAERVALCVNACAHMEDPVRTISLMQDYRHQLTGLQDDITKLTQRLEEREQSISYWQGQVSDFQKEADRLRKALDTIANDAVPECPFGIGKNSDLRPEDPCPLCGELGDGSTDGSRCFGEKGAAAFARSVLQPGKPRFLTKEEYETMDPPFPPEPGYEDAEEDIS